MIKIKNVYEGHSESDGFRILVDRFWPRAVSKEKASIDLWLKEIAPANDLRKWYSHDPKKWEEFKSKYFTELQEKEEIIEKIRELEKESNLTLVYSSKSPLNNAAALLEYLKVNS
ncbi:DUF488 family protein [Thermodesulfobium sp. 4217-1]|uniref:DUF488 domain-containing protein n=1 Tax=Thermodesulfobium sp. 4217-1 TaxID=3120013 RepID=UPI003221D5F8